MSVTNIFKILTLKEFESTTKITQTVEILGFLSGTRLSFRCIAFPVEVWRQIFTSLPILVYYDS